MCCYNHLYVAQLRENTVFFFPVLKDMPFVSLAKKSSVAFGLETMAHLSITLPSGPHFLFSFFKENPPQNFLFYPHLKTFLLSLSETDREGEGKRNRERWTDRHINVREKHQLAAFLCAPLLGIEHALWATLTGNRTCGSPSIHGTMF